MTPKRERMVRGRKAPNILRCSRTEWMAAWEDAVRPRPRITQKTQNLDKNLDINQAQNGQVKE